jgi:surface protein
MFRNASSANPDTSNWNVSSVTDMGNMFESASSANPDTSNWDVSSVTNMIYMFANTSSANPDVSLWDVGSVTDMSLMFLNTSIANPDVLLWDVGSVTDMSFMFENSNLSVENLTAIYENWSQLNLQQNVEFGAGNTKYNASGQAGRDILVNTYNWIITDGGENLFLNQFPNASLGLSLDLLDKNYTGFCIRVRRSSDNNELDIGFVNNELDTASLLDFVGSGNGFVSIIYDQVGSNNMTKTTANLQGQIVSNGEVILKGEKPCIIRSANDDGGYISTYSPNDGVAVKGMFYVGDNENKKSSMYGSFDGVVDRGVFCEASTNTTVDSFQTITANKVNGVDVTFTNRQDSLNKLNKHFLLYREIDFNFENNVLGLGFRAINPVKFGMYTFQELVIFENTDNAVAKQNNINERYNIY